MIVTHEAVKELDELNELIDWSRAQQHLSHLHAKSRDEKAWPPLFMFKSLLLQRQITAVAAHMIRITLLTYLVTMNQHRMRTASIKVKSMISGYRHKT